MIGKHRVLIPNVKTKQWQLVILGGEQWAKFENDYNGKPAQRTDETLAIRVCFLGRELWTKLSVIDTFYSVLRYKLTSYRLMNCDKSATNFKTLTFKNKIY